MAEQLRVFVSHSHQDNAFCQQIVQALRDAGADVWYDEHNLGWGELHEVIQRELGRRAVFVLILSKAVFASQWVKRETVWAYKLYSRDPSRAIVPVTARKIDAADFDPETGWLFLNDFKRIEAPGYKPYRPAEAARRLLNALALTPAGETSAPVEPQPSEDLNDLLTRGKAMIAQKQYAEALPLFERAAQLSPDSFAAWVNIGYVLTNLGRDHDALTAVDHVLSLNSNFASAWVAKGTTLGKLGRFSDALAAYDRALVLDPNNALAWSTKGDALDDLGRYDEALAAYDQALALDPDKALTWGSKGQSLANQERHEEALATFERAIVLDSTMWWSWQGKADALRELGHTAEAEAVEQHADELRAKG